MCTACQPPHFTSCAGLQSRKPSGRCLLTSCLRLSVCCWPCCLCAASNSLSVSASSTSTFCFFSFFSSGLPPSTPLLLLCFRVSSWLMALLATFSLPRCVVCLCSATPS